MNLEFIEAIERAPYSMIYDEPNHCHQDEKCLVATTTIQIRVSLSFPKQNQGP